ncbi:hypothetical protein P152DRAFT_324651 [Eremomyces bilateralis CBS 781.70]|uniref:Betaine lipid synthase n=1 Tax=Eremomyces bilateralis CBS 781.70 TaxID=1392243 RepID=A0A6G1G4I1_9PEZI|nr:uncharacterized protein P152DRAFT_324651 [Eremomyces bilateralis CBS 781.70]KAF1812739.1 hypothetical protein P152DRAFT_324651 [Eremomyces bilateralis CBS 781.70]
MFDALLSPLTRDPMLQVLIVLASLTVFLSGILVAAFSSHFKYADLKESAYAYGKFAYGCFLKPHSGDTGNQQDALESFYRAQASAYDATREKLLRGREDMLGLVAAQMAHRKESGALLNKIIWVDIGGGTGWNIEEMGRFLDVQTFFHAVYLVDFSPSLCEVARARFERLGWANVKVICQDARKFRLQDHETPDVEKAASEISGAPYEPDQPPALVGADLVTMSYALSMIPEYYSVIDSLANLLSPTGIFGVCDFYVQSRHDYQNRNYTGGFVDRHCTWISRTFWRTWFEIDRVNLEPARRDYLEYKFGTVLSTNGRNHFFGVRIPYYVWIGCAKESALTENRIAELDAAATESPFLSALDLQVKTQYQRTNYFDNRSKAFMSAVVNLAASLPLPSSWYQNHHWRIYYDDRLPKHTQFNNDYIYAFTWEDSRVDARLLKIQPDDVILALSSAGDNILSYLLQGSKRVHAVDLNPSQNHLLELKAAAFQALGYADFWKVFGEGRHENFQQLLIEKLSPHMSSAAFQFWLHRGPDTFGKTGLYSTGGSRHAIVLLRHLFKVLGMRTEVDRLCTAGTLNEQKEVWHRSIRRVLLSRLLCWAIVSNEKWLWKALGVPPNQRALIEHDYIRQGDAQDASRDIPTARANNTGRAIWAYVENTLDPVVENTLLSDDNHYYLMCLQGRYSRRSHPEYLSPSAHVQLSRPGAFDGLRIHTDEINEVISRMTPGTLSIAVVMDSMDWFDTDGREATTQIERLNRALKMGGRVFLRSAGCNPWYIQRFEENGFAPKRVAVRVPGSCMDRVNMYASTWICTKVGEIEGHRLRKTSSPVTPLEL